MTTTDTAPAPDAPTEKPQQPAIVSLRADVLRRVLDGLLPFAANGDYEIPVLSAIRLRTRDDGQFTAIATDRYRAGMVRLAGADVWDVAGTVDATIPWDAVKALITWLPDNIAGATVTITQTGNRVDVELVKPDGPQHGVPAFSFGAIDTPAYPEVEHVIRDHMDKQPNLTEPIGLDARLISSLDKFQWNLLRDPVRVWASDPHGAIAVAVGDHFVGCVMTVKHQDDRCRKDGKGGVHVPWLTYDEAIWGPILGEPTAHIGADQADDTPDEQDTAVARKLVDHLDGDDLVFDGYEYDVDAGTDGAWMRLVPHDPLMPILRVHLAVEVVEEKP